ncbi:hypothetical protein HPB50_022792 [Hyalomma asiaticum]|uniref:Uncharacterized protein n=1 Tax=Hyalomma asiaticum TaxID=266040 RepID=A0ACB7SK15_HYAAI|nr:hypothetical protein HPB50_022792 [Hyalomma asiaticum]
MVEQGSAEREHAEYSYCCAFGGPRAAAPPSGNLSPNNDPGEEVTRLPFIEPSVTERAPLTFSMIRLGVLLAPCYAAFPKNALISGPWRLDRRDGWMNSVTSSLDTTSQWKQIELLQQLQEKEGLKAATNFCVPMMSTTARCIRQRGCWNNNPSAAQFRNTYRTLVHARVLSSNSSNVVPQVNGIRLSSILEDISSSPSGKLWPYSVEPNDCHTTPQTKKQYLICVTDLSDTYLRLLTLRRSSRRGHYYQA